MQKEMILKASLLDLVFEGRNKAYGAYELRSHYAGRLGKAVGTVMVLSVAVVLSSFFAKKPGATQGSLVQVDSITLVEAHINPEPKVPEPEPKPAVPVATAASTPPLILPDAVVPPDDLVPDVDRLDTSQIGAENRDGVPHDNTVGVVAAGHGQGEVAAVAPTVIEDPEIIYRVVEHAAEFPGGIAAWRRYLQSHLNYPEAAQENGAQGQVRVQFVVDKTGNISAVEALNDPGYGIADEAVRIIRRGPKWKPAQQNGQFVNYRHIQTIVFALE
ncbi:MAG: energy transducer TonB [Bacteroidetes bacterium]|nr:MAG: energy transducer TonB [Bacteroidota bacterium]